MAQYTADFLAAARHGYETTDQPMRDLARELGIGITTLSTLAEKHGWAKRSLRQRGMPPAMQLLAEAQALAAKAPIHSRANGNPETAQQQTSEGLGPRILPETRFALLRGDERSESGPATGVAAEPPDLLVKLEQILAQLIAAAEAAPANGIHSPQGARTLATLIQAMRALKAMRGHSFTEPGPIENDDDDMPEDIDEFRLDLARRIDAFVASRTDAGDAVANSPPAPLAADE
jgi:hypothetical protein